MNMHSASMVSMTQLFGRLDGNPTYMDRGQVGSSLSTSTYIESWKSSGTSVFGGVDGHIVRARQYDLASAKQKPLRFVVSAENLNSFADVSFRVNLKLEEIYTMDAAAIINPEISRYAVRKGIDVVEDLVEVGDLNSLNEILARARPDMMRRATAVAVLRSAYRLRGKLSKWMRFYTEVFAHLEATQQDPHRALKGLVRSRV